MVNHLSCAGSLVTPTGAIHEAGAGMQAAASLYESEPIGKNPGSFADRAHSLPAGWCPVYRRRYQQLGAHQCVAVEEAAKIVQA